DELDARGSSLETLRKTAPDDPLSQLLARSGPLFTEATARLHDDDAPLADRLAAAALLARHAPAREDALAFFHGQLRDGLHGAHWPEILAAAASTGDPALPEPVLDLWPQLSPLQRRLSLAALLSRPAWTTALLDAFSAGTLRPADVDATRRMQLL